MTSPRTIAISIANIISHPTQTNHQNKATVGEFDIESLANIQEETTAHDMICITSLPFNYIVMIMVITQVNSKYMPTKIHHGFNLVKTLKENQLVTILVYLHNSQHQCQ